MPKSNTHPKWIENAQVLCDGKPLCLIGSTKKELQVDIWLANHPFYNNSQILVDTEGRVEKFMKKYGLDTTKTTD
jgi:large subunit ribosomal protein L31